MRRLLPLSSRDIRYESFFYAGNQLLIVRSSMRFNRGAIRKCGNAIVDFMEFVMNTRPVPPLTAVLPSAPDTRKPKVHKPHQNADVRWEPQAAEFSELALDDRDTHEIINGFCGGRYRHWGD
jgi:hypothetical protein